jgi:hypothetical protein
VHTRRIAHTRTQDPYWAYAVQRYMYATMKTLEAAQDPRVLIIRYEDLVKNTTGTLKVLFDFLGESYDEDQILSYHRTQVSVALDALVFMFVLILLLRCVAVQVGRLGGGTPPPPPPPPTHTHTHKHTATFCSSSFSPFSHRRPVPLHQLLPCSVPTFTIGGVSTLWRDRDRWSTRGRSLTHRRLSRTTNRGTSACTSKFA